MDQPAESHWPLALMLVATQLSVGMLLIEWIAMAIFSVVGLEMSVSATAINAAAAMLIGGLGMGVAPLHLGQPSRAWRVFLGLRTSWLSREAIVLGNYMGVLLIAVALLWLPAVADLVSHSISDRIPAWAGRATLGVACLFGTAGLYCSAMIYIATQRDLWRAPRTLPRFFGTALGGGASMVAVCWVIGGASRVAVAAALALAGVAMVIKLTWEWRIYLGGPRHDDDSYDRRSRRLVAHQLPRLRDCRIALGIAAVGLAVCGSGSALIIGETKETLMFAVLFAIALSLGECCERLLYFSSVVYDRMPGTFR